MLTCHFVSRSLVYLPFIISRRWKVRILPKEHYGDDETPYMPARKPRISFFNTVLFTLHKKYMGLLEINEWLQMKEEKNFRNDQRYMPERHKCLGPDLAATHFIVTRGGKVKFAGSNMWLTKEHIGMGEIPSTYTPGFHVEELDASGFPLIYEGFDNIGNLIKLKKLYLRNNPRLDDWCLSRFHLFENTLEYLDISSCNLVTERGICTLHVLKKLKCLVINDTPNIQNKELACLLLQDVLPECEIIGVNYNDPIMMKRIGEYLNK